MLITLVSIFYEPDEPPDERLSHVGIFQPEVGTARDGRASLLFSWCDDGQHGAVPEGAGELQEISRCLQVSKTKPVNRPTSERKELYGRVNV